MSHVKHNGFMVARCEMACTRGVEGELQHDEVSVLRHDQRLQQADLFGALLTGEQHRHDLGHETIQELLPPSVGLLLAAKRRHINVRKCSSQLVPP
jgi:hypothetical protein